MSLITYVSLDNQSGIEDGQSWETAFTTIDQALDTDAERIWIASGTFPGFTPRLSDTKIYGSFIGNESIPGYDENGVPLVPDREGETIIEGMIDIRVRGIIIDGLSIVRSPENGIRVSNASARISQCYFAENTVHVHVEDNSTVYIDDCDMHAAYGIGDGGALYVKKSNVEVTRTNIRECTTVKGSALYATRESNVTMLELDIFDNSADRGTIYCTDKSFVEIVDSDIYNNSAIAGPGIYATGLGTVNVLNCTINGNTKRRNNRRQLESGGI